MDTKGMIRTQALLAIAFFSSACAKPPDLVVAGIRVPQPVVLENITSAHDGGTIAFVIKGRDGSIPVCLDGRMSIPTNERYSYFGAVYPTAPGASVMKNGSEAQVAIIKVLELWLHDHSSLENRGKGLRHVEEMSKEEIEFLHIQSAAKRLRELAGS